MRILLLHHLSRVVLAAGALVCALPATSASAQVVSGGVLRELGMTPTVGRGYAPSSNGLYSICFEQVPTLAPSFSFDYRFVDVAQDGAIRGRGGDGVRDAAIADMLRAATPEAGRRHLVGILTVDSFYASLDETQAQLSAPALALLHRGDLLGFFTACGSHYVRSLSRRSYFVTLFSYTGTDARSDRSFEQDLERAVRQFSITGGHAPEDEHAAFAARARQQHLRITIRAVGLGPERTPDVAPFDLQQYLAALRGALEVAQREPAGRVTAMEVTPWLSNPLVLGAIDVRAPDVAHRMRISENTQLVLALDARLGHDQDLVDLARTCRASIEDRELARRGPQTELIGHRTGRRMSLATVADAVSEDAIGRLEAAARSYAGTDDRGGALACITALEQSGLDLDTHTVPACQAAHDDLVTAADLIEDFCPPEPASVLLAPAAPERDPPEAGPPMWRNRLPHRARTIEAAPRLSPPPRPALVLEIDRPLVAPAWSYALGAGLQVRRDGVAGTYHARLGLPLGAELGLAYRAPISTSALTRALAVTAALRAYRGAHLELAPHAAARLALDGDVPSWGALGLSASLTYARRVQLRLGGDQLLLDARGAVLAVPVRVGVQLSGSTFIRADLVLPVVALGPDGLALASTRVRGGAIVRLGSRLDLLLHVQADAPAMAPAATSAVVGLRYRGGW
jgi:hypothetical protein